jgi:hypothetical protein
MENGEGAKIVICTAPPGLCAVIKNLEKASDSDVLYTIQIVTAFRYIYYEDSARGIFSEPLVYCESKNTSALVGGKSRIEFVGSLENCVLKIKELLSAYYADQTAKKNGL